MIALTQEKREELIACANEIKKMATGTHGYKVGNDAFGSNALMLMEVAIASLKESVFAYGISDPEGKVHLDEACCIDSDGQWVSDEVITLNDGVTDLETGYKVVQLFTAPPVPEIKLPSNLQDAFEDGNKIPPNTRRCGDSYCVSTFHNWKGEEFMHQFEGFLKGVNYVKHLNGLR